MSAKGTPAQIARIMWSTWGPPGPHVGSIHIGWCVLWQGSFVKCTHVQKSWWRHEMETFSALLAICAGNSHVPGKFPAQRQVTRNFDVFFDLRPNKRLSKQPRGWWFETSSWPLWRHRNVLPWHWGTHVISPVHRFSPREHGWIYNVDPQGSAK